MFVWIFGLLVFIGLVIFAIRSDGWCGIGESIGIPFFLGIIGVLIACIISLLLGMCTPDCLKGEISRTETQLVALQDNMSYQGYRGRYVYRGYFEEELQYTYLYEEEGKGITSGQCNADKTYINYIQGDEKPKLITVQFGVVNPIWDFFTFSEEELCGCGKCNSEYYLYIPEGSIVAEGEYEIDLE